MPEITVSLIWPILAVFFGTVFCLSLSTWTENRGEDTGYKRAQAEAIVAMSQAERAVETAYGCKNTKDRHASVLLLVTEWERRFDVPEPQHHISHELGRRIASLDKDAPKVNTTQGKAS